MKKKNEGRKEGRKERKKARESEINKTKGKRNPVP